MTVTLNAKDKLVLTKELKAIKLRLLILQNQVELSPPSLELLKANQVVIRDLFRVYRELPVKVYTPIIRNS